jgi:hypothetical protein
MAKRGRPKLPDEERKGVSFTFLMDEELSKMLDQKAELLGVSRSKAVRLGIKFLDPYLIWLDKAEAQNA